MKTKPFAVRVPLALAIALERQAEKEAVTVADVIRRILASSQSSHKDQLLEKLVAIETQVKLLRQSQNQIITKLDEFDVDVDVDGGELQ
ncbi:MAG: hypothetical protein EON51_10220 [Acinetobacter sp.]|nr:MAG: hypothetical protein EON51_10220 [Acinetobacter sp.]